jgi:hypothetical protein
MFNLRVIIYLLIHLTYSTLVATYMLVNFLLFWNYQQIQLLILCICAYGFCVFGVGLTLLIRREWLMIHMYVIVAQLIQGLVWIIMELSYLMTIFPAVDRIVICLINWFIVIMFYCFIRHNVYIITPLETKYIVDVARNIPPPLPPTIREYDIKPFVLVPSELLTTSESII